VTGFEDGDEYIDFEPTTGDVEEAEQNRTWTALPWAVRLRVAELELVRNTPFARYRLRELESWDAIRGRSGGSRRPSAASTPDQLPRTGIFASSTRFSTVSTLPFS
jgi:hypothetical protein